MGDPDNSRRWKRISAMRIEGNARPVGDVSRIKWRRWDGERFVEVER